METPITTATTTTKTTPSWVSEPRFLFRQRKYFFTSGLFYLMMTSSSNNFERLNRKSSAMAHRRPFKTTAAVLILGLLWSSASTEAQATENVVVQATEAKTGHATKGRWSNFFKVVTFKVNPERVNILSVRCASASITALSNQDQLLLFSKLLCSQLNIVLVLLKFRFDERISFQ